MYAGKKAEGLAGRQADVFIDEIPERIGQVLRETLMNRLSPKGNTTSAKYRLTVLLGEPTISSQGVRKDNFATRYQMMYTAKYVLTAYPSGEELTKGSVSERASYDVLASPYASDTAEETIKERLMKILGESVSLRIGAYLEQNP